jgi:hypothetical protein
MYMEYNSIPRPPFLQYLPLHRELGRFAQDLTGNTIYIYYLKIKPNSVRIRS